MLTSDARYASGLAVADADASSVLDTFLKRDNAMREKSPCETRYLKISARRDW